MREGCLFLKIERHFSPAEIYSSNQGVVGENALRDTPRKRRLHNTTDSRFVQDLKIIKLNDLEVAFLPKKRFRTERATTHTKILTRSAKEASSGSLLQQRSKTSATGTPANADVITKRTNEAKKTPKDTVRSPEA